jgi:hypothetical protein
MVMPLFGMQGMEVQKFADWGGVVGDGCDGTT